MSRIEVSQVHDDVLLAELHFIAYVPLLLSGSISAVTPTFQPDNWLRKLASLNQTENYMGFLKRSSAYTAALIRIGS